MLRAPAEGCLFFYVSPPVSGIAQRIYGSWILEIRDKRLFFVGEGHRKSERYRAKLCDQHKFCALRSVLLGTGER